MSLKPKIVHIPRRFVKEQWGGTETVILETSKELIKAGYDVEVYTSLALSNKKSEIIYGLPVKRHKYFYTYFGLHKKTKTLLDEKGGNLFSISLFFSLLFLRNVKLFHLHTMSRLGGIVRTVAKLRKIPYFVSIHGGFLNIPQEIANDMLKTTKGLFDFGKPLGFMVGSRKVLQDANAIICVDKQEKELIKNKFPEKEVVFMPNGVNLDKFASGNAVRFKKKYNISPQDTVLLSVSSFYPQKNLLLLVDAFKKIKDIESNSKLVLIGIIYDKSYFAELKEKIFKMGLRDSVIVLTDVKFDDSDLADAYHACDIFVLPSKYEAFGIVILEAWAAKKPIICGKTGGMTHFVKDNENGCFFDVNSPENLAEKIIKIMKNKYIAASLAKNGFESAKEYSWEKVTKNLMDLYETASK